MNDLSDPGRLAALRRYHILQSPEERAFDRIVRLTARLLNTPMAGIHFIDEACQWAKAQVGLELKTLDLDVSFCARALGDEEVLVVEDATQDPRFRENPLVTGEPGIRFYAGAALVTPDGYALGRLCVIDTEPRPGGLGPEERATLQELAAVVVDELEYRVQPRSREEILESITDAFVAIDRDGRLTYVNERAAALLQRPREQLLDEDAWEAFPEAVESEFREQCDRARRTGERVEFEVYVPPLDTWFHVKAYPYGGGLSIYFDDITERKAQATQLRLLSRAVEDAAEAVLITGPEFDEPGPRIEYVNPAFEEMTGYVAEEVIGKTPRILQGPETNRAVLDVVRSHLKRGKPLTNTTAVNYRKDGTPFWVEWNIAPVHGPHGEIQHWVSVQRDVTEQRALQAELREREEYLSVTLNSIGDAVITTDPDGRVNEMNDVAERLTGWTQDAAEGVPLDDIFKIHNAKTGAPVESPVAKVLREGEIVGLANHTVLTTHDGTERQIADSAAPIRADDGELLGVVLVFRDVTAQYERREALRRERERLEMALVGGDLGMWDWNMNTDEVIYDARWAEMLGYALDEVESTEAFFTEHTHPEDLARVHEATQRHARGEAPHINLEIRMRHKDDSWRWILDRGKIVEWNEDGSPRRMVGTHMNITERKRRETIEQRFGRILEAAPSEIYVFSAETLQFVQTSRGARENLGYSEAELGEMTPLDLKPFRQDEFEALIAPLRTDEKELITFETTHRRQDGTTYPVQVRLQLSRQETPPVFIAIVLDITERARREQELIAAKERAEEMSQLKSAFLANMSHEIRTPLTSIIGFADVLRGQVEGETEELLGMIRESGKRLEETLTSVLDLAKIEGESMRIRPERVDLAREVRTAAGLFRPRAEEKDLELRVHVPDGPTPATLDARALRRVLSNLISNAVKFTDEGSVEVRLRFGEHEATIEVEDTGIGIAPEQMDRIFEEFAQESEGYTRNYEGVGLGLSITRRLVELLGGRIEAESEKGKGSLFRVMLPQERPPTSAEPDGAEAPDQPNELASPTQTPETGGGALASTTSPPERSAEQPAKEERVEARPSVEKRLDTSGEKTRLLLVEDNELARRVLPMLLHQLDDQCVVDTTASAEEALAQAEKVPYDLFLIDINLGAGPTGLDVINRLREMAHHAETPTVACTAYAMPGDEDAFLKAGFDAYLAKPFRAQELRATLQRVLGR